jgi:D-alanyl-lipoteichoic acid acyltransferase DltB (MBOAT superfamily)
LEFTSLWFFLYLVIVSLVYRVAPARVQPLLLVAASYAYYFSWGVDPARILLAFTMAAFFGAHAMSAAGSERKKQIILLSLLTGFVGLLVAFKATAFLPGRMHGWALPLGMSYYTFKVVSYVVDVYCGKTTPERHFLPFAAYVAFFPQIVAGPIQRSENFLPQVRKGNRVRLGAAIVGLQRILMGYFKKFVVSDGLAVLVNLSYGYLDDPGGSVLLGFYAFPLQLYADFSGLTDIAVGAALLLGIESPENFNAPFSAPNPSDFWRRWHMTLTNWLTEYVFTPARLATRAWGNAGLVFSVWLNMILIGLWHGFRWSLLFFGALHALYLTIDALTLAARKRYYKRHPGVSRLTDWIGPVITFHLVACSFVFFRAATFSDALRILGHLSAGIGAISPEFLEALRESSRAIVPALAGIALAESADYLRRRNRQGELVGALPRWGRWSVYCCTAVTVIIMIFLVEGLNATHNPFVYQVF